MLRTINRILVPISIQFCRSSLKKFIARDIALWGCRNVQPNFLQVLAQTAHPVGIRTMTITPDMELGYEQFVKVKDEGKALIIDVRSPEELQQDGKINGTINIPLSQLGFALEYLSAHEFECKYGVPKPKLDSFILFHCKSGGRSSKALQIALDLGYKNAKHYKGGFNDWLAHTDTSSASD